MPKHKHDILTCYDHQGNLLCGRSVHLPSELPKATKLWLQCAKTLFGSFFGRQCRLGLGHKGKHKF